MDKPVRPHKGILKVPKDRSLREKLRKEIAVYVKENHILPPAGMESLEYHAGILRDKLGIDQAYLNFMIILLGNESWRETVAATPFHRRLLLLPQCLHNNIHCQGVFDELGLVCAGCKNCQIDGIIQKAEEAGYATLVAEGTSVAIRLVEEGSIDAVIGVSCMPVLQNSFVPVTRAAVPVIGLPLLFDGCKDTTLDYSWLFSEMEQFSENQEMKPLSVSLIKNQVNEYFTENRLKSFFPGNTETEKMALEMISAGGQRMRPLLSLLAYQAYSKQVSDEVQANLAVVIECFHKASLVHDDIQDDEDFRYNRPALHKTAGIPMAINIGDYLIGKGYQLLASMPCSPEVKTECFKIVAASHTSLSEGQGADILLQQNIIRFSSEKVLHIFEQKTGEAVKVALLTAAVAGDAPPHDMEVLSRFSENFGVAYQIRDDLTELREMNEFKHAFDFPFLLSLLNERINGEAPAFTEIIEKGRLHLLLDFLNKYNIEATADEYLNRYILKCYQELDQLQNHKLRLSLYGLMGKVFYS